MTYKCKAALKPWTELREDKKTEKKIKRVKICIEGKGENQKLSLDNNKRGEKSLLTLEKFLTGEE